MPNRPKTHKPYCPAVKRDDGKYKFIKSARWRGIRKRFLARHPLCEDCGKIATEVHHRNDSHADNSVSNLCPLCKSCHSKRTNAEQGGVGKPKTVQQSPAKRQWDENFRFA